jgi:PEP-CTERM motif
MQRFKACVRMFPLGIALVFLAPFAHASALTYDSSCDLTLDWFGPDPIPPPLSISGTAAGSNSGCSLMALAAGIYSFTSSASNVNTSVSGSVITLSNSFSGLGPVDSDVPIVTSGSDRLEGSSSAEVGGTFTATYVLTGPNIANDTVEIPYILNDQHSDPQCTDHGGCITASITQNGNEVLLFDGLPTFPTLLSGIDVSQPFQLSINFHAQIGSGCCALDAGGPLDVIVTFDVFDANGDPVSADLVSVPEPGSITMMCAGVGLFVLGRVRHRRGRTRRRIVATSTLTLGPVAQRGFDNAEF